MFPINNYQNQLQSLSNQIQQMQNMPQYQQPVQPQISMPSSISTPNISTVTGIEGATAYSIPPNSSILLMDNNDLIVYFKSSDANGMVTLKAYRMIEIERNEQSDASDLATKNDLIAMKQELLDMIERSKYGGSKNESFKKSDKS